jgi:intein/homing endonuclease
MANRLISKSRIEHLRRIAKIGGKTGARLRIEDPRREAARKKKWLEWWNEKGKVLWNPVKTLLPIRSPKPSKKLAEFVGIMIGDGTVAPYHIAITLNTITDNEYILFVASLAERLFGVKPKIYNRKGCKATDIVIHSKNIVEFCKKIDLKQGDKLKHGLDIPMWVLKDRDFSKACIRGLFDTDGSLFEHNYSVNGKRYSYLKLSFTSRSPVLIGRVLRTLVGLGFNTKLRKNGFELKIEDRGSVSKFMRVIGTSNPRRRTLYDNFDN